MNSYWSLLVMFYQRYVAPDAPLATFLSSQFSKRGAAINVRQPEFIENHQTMVLDFRIQSWNSYFFWTDSWSKYVLPYRYFFHIDKISVWLVVWNMIFIFHILGMSPSQLTNSIIFQRGWFNHQPYRYYSYINYSHYFGCHSWTITINHQLFITKLL